MKRSSTSRWIRRRSRSSVVPINRIIERPIPTRQEGDVTIISVTKEVLVVERRLMFTEEVRITRRRSEFHEPQRVTVQSEEIEIEHIPHREASPIIVAAKTLVPS